MDNYEIEITNRLSAFFNERLMPLAETMRKRGIELFPRGPDANRSSYFIDRSDNGNYIHELDPENIANELREMWTSGDLPELSVIADEMVDIAQSLKENEKAQDEISPFIYAMF